MTTSEADGPLYVWAWLPGRPEPVVCGRLDRDGRRIVFTYGRSYLDRPDAIPLLLPDLPLARGPIPPRAGDLHGPIADAGPDAWGRRVIESRRIDGAAGAAPHLDELTYLRESGSNRIGGLDFQNAPDVYLARGDVAVALETLVEAAAMVESGETLPAALDVALLHGSSVGGARPKALLDDAGRGLIAKFGSATDTYPVVKSEFVAMRLAALAGLRVAEVHLTHTLGKDVLLVERFDRPGDGTRRLMVSALTILGLDAFPGGRYASYPDLAAEIRARFADPVPTLHELFARIVFNVIVGNGDDHARNHAAFWDGRLLTLTPAYDLCPSPRAGREFTQAMAIGEDGWRQAQLAGCARRASPFRLSEAQAREIIDHQIAVVRDRFDAVCDEAGLAARNRAAMWERQIMNPYALEGY